MVVLVGARLVVPRKVVENAIVRDMTVRARRMENLYMVIVYFASVINER